MELVEGALDSMTIPEMLLPEQWAAMHKAAHLSPEKRLMFAVFYDALNVIRLGANGSSKGGGRISGADAYDANEWLTSATDDGFYSFVNICEVFNLDADKIREKILLGQYTPTRRSPVNYAQIGQRVAA